MDIDNITLVIRTFPIRVAGDSGPLEHETSWVEIARQCGLPPDFCELTTATKKIRRVGHFEPEIVRKAIAVNNPTELVLNHVDYLDPEVRSGKISARVRSFVRELEERVGFSVSWMGTGPASLVPCESVHSVFAA